MPRISSGPGRREFSWSRVEYQVVARRPELGHIHYRSHRIRLLRAPLPHPIFRPEEEHVASGEDDVVPPVRRGHLAMEEPVGGRRAVEAHRELQRLPALFAARMDHGPARGAPPGSPARPRRSWRSRKRPRSRRDAAFRRPRRAAPCGWTRRRLPAPARASRAAARRRRAPRPRPRPLARPSRRVKARGRSRRSAGRRRASRSVSRSMARSLPSIAPGGGLWRRGLYFFTASHLPRPTW